MNLFEGVYAGRRVLITGDSGFKGSWLALWLESMGAEVSGLSLPAGSTPNHDALLGLPYSKLRGDIRDYEWLAESLKKANPEFIFHLAAQPLVRRSYNNPLETWQTNVLGTVNLLEACREHPSARAIVLVTTDKVYRNEEWLWGYREHDRVGGHDPYSASKACCELVIDSYRSAFFSTHADGPLLASARAGNVIGGGDWAEDRLIPDIARGTANSRPIEIRSPDATRPWQHVLECLSGYLMIGQRLLNGDKTCAGAWNIGPESSDNRKVIEVLQAMKVHWPEMAWHATCVPQPHEANLLYLDSSKAKAILGWKPVWDLATALEKTAIWYHSFAKTGSVLSRQQLREYISCARDMGCKWAV